MHSVTCWAIKGRLGAPVVRHRDQGKRNIVQSISAVALVVKDYDKAVQFFTHSLRFTVEVARIGESPGPLILTLSLLAH
jgi:hypothetical protein